MCQGRASQNKPIQKLNDVMKIQVPVPYPFCHLQRINSAQGLKMAAGVPGVTSGYNNFKKKRDGSSLVVGVEPPAATVTATMTTTAGAAAGSAQPLGALCRAGSCRRPWSTRSC